MIIKLGENMLFVVNAVFKKNRKITLRAYPYSFMISRITGGIFTIIFQLLIYYCVFKKAMDVNFEDYVGSSDYISYIVLGQALNVLSFATLMNVGRCLISEIREGTIDNFILSPASRIGYFVGAYVEQLGRSAIEFTIIMLVGIICGMRLPSVIIGRCAVVLIIASLAFFSLAMLVSSIMIYTRDTYLVQNTIYIFMELVCGVLFPSEYMPRIMQYVSCIFPLTPALKLFRSCILLGDSISSNWYLVVNILILSLCYGTIGYFIYIGIEKKLIEEVLA